MLFSPFSGRCRDSFIDARFLDMCFTFVGFNNLTEGLKKCAKIQSSIISITSTEENDFLTRLVGNYFFVCVRCRIFKTNLVLKMTVFNCIL